MKFVATQLAVYGSQILRIRTRELNSAVYRLPFRYLKSRKKALDVFDQTADAGPRLIAGLVI